MFTLGRKNEVLVMREDGSFFRLSADTQAELFVLIAMWEQPIETWNGEFKTFTQIANSEENTVSLRIVTK